MRCLVTCSFSFCVATFLVALLPSCAKEDQPTSGPVSPLDEPVIELSFGRRILCELPEAAGGDRCKVICDSSGRLWLFIARFQSLSYSTYEGETWTPVKPVCSSEWKFINRMTAVVDGTGLPIVIWAGFDGGPGESLAAVRWNGSDFGRPWCLDRLPAGKSIGGLDAILDCGGRLHVAYDRPLSPPEEYATGSIIVDGEFPDKLFHIVFDGQGWSVPHPTTGKGQYYVDDVVLSSDLKGKVCLSAVIAPFGTSAKRDYVAYQIWSSGKWSSAARGSPEGQDVSEGQAAIDPDGAVHVWWAVGFNPTLYCALPQKRVAPGTAREWYDPPFLARLSGPLLAANSSGFVSVWNGAVWCRPLETGGSEGIAAGPNHKVFTWVWADEGVVIQEMLVANKGTPRNHDD